MALTDLCDPAVERAVVGSVLSGGRERYNILARHLRAGDFYLDGYDRLWRLLARLPVIDFLTVSQAAKANGLARCGIDELDLCRCINAWSFRSGALVDADFCINGALVGPDDYATMLARQIHALATCRRVGRRLQSILKRALGYADVPDAHTMYPKSEVEHDRQGLETARAEDCPTPGRPARWPHRAAEP